MIICLSLDEIPISKLKKSGAINYTLMFKI